MFPIEVAQDLNLTLNPENAQRYRGVGAGHITAYFAQVTIDIGGTKVPLYAGFSDAPSIVPILGQGGFFDRFEVKFNRAEGSHRTAPHHPLEIILSPPFPHRK